MSSNQHTARFQLFLLSLPVLLVVQAVGCASSVEPSAADTTTSAATGSASSTEPLACEVESFGGCLEKSFRATAFDSCLDTQESAYLTSEVFDALSGDQPVAFEIELGSTAAEPHCAWFDDVLVIGDGTAVMRRLAGVFGEPPIFRRVEIKPVAFFDDCRASSDPTSLTHCLREWFVPGTCVAPVCCPVGGPNACP